MTIKTTAERVTRECGRGYNMLDALNELADKCKAADELLAEIESLAEACDIGYVPYSTIPGGYYHGVNSNVDEIKLEAERLAEVRS